MFKLLDKVFVVDTTFGKPKMLHGRIIAIISHSEERLVNINTEGDEAVEGQSNKFYNVQEIDNKDIPTRHIVHVTELFATKKEAKDNFVKSI